MVGNHKGFSSTCEWNIHNILELHYKKNGEIISSMPDSQKQGYTLVKEEEKCRSGADFKYAALVTSGC